jgi:hypothetical protein
VKDDGGGWRRGNQSLWKDFECRDSNGVCALTMTADPTTVACKMLDVFGEFCGL